MERRVQLLDCPFPRDSIVSPFKSVHVRGEKFVFLEHGPEDGPLVLCLHGFPDIPMGFGPLLEALGACGFRAIAPFLRGYAPSCNEGAMDMESLGNDVLGLGLTLSPKRSFAVVGHDVGAVATYGAMALQPSRVACAVTMAVPHPAAFLRNLPRRPDQWLRSCYMALFQGGRSVEALVEAGDFALVDALWARWAPGWHPPPSYRRAVHDCLQASMPHPLGFYRALVRPPARALGLFRRFVSQNQGDTTVPVLSMHGARDGCIHPALGRNQRSHFHGPFEEVLFPNLGHFLHLEEPSTIVRRTVAWVTKYLTVERVVVS